MGLLSDLFPHGDMKGISSTYAADYTAPKPMQRLQSTTPGNKTTPSNKTTPEPLSLDLGHRLFPTPPNLNEQGLRRLKFK